MIIINNQDFEDNFKSLLLMLGVEDYISRTYIINPIIEENKRHNEFDDMMKNFILPKKRKVTYAELIKIFTIREGYYPCWMKIINIDSEVVIDTSLRMRKLKNTLCVGEYHPFHAELL